MIRLIPWLMIALTAAAAFVAWDMQRDARIAAEARADLAERNMQTAITERDLARQAQDVAEAYRIAAEARLRTAQDVIAMIEEQSDATDTAPETIRRLAQCRADGVPWSDCLRAVAD